MSEWKKQDSGEIWLPEKKEEEIIGAVKDILLEGQYGIQLMIEKEDGVMIMTPSHKVLQNRIRQVKKGQDIKIVYIGEELPKVKGQNPTKMYDVYIKDSMEAEEETVE